LASQLGSETAVLMGSLHAGDPLDGGPKPEPRHHPVSRFRHDARHGQGRIRRVSTREQNLDAQVDLLEKVSCARVFVDKVSGKLARRPH
jgi:resolvase-like protein